MDGATGLRWDGDHCGHFQRDDQVSNIEQKWEIMMGTNMDLLSLTEFRWKNLPE